MMLATVIDHPFVGNMAAVGDILMQRFRPGQLANSHGWQVAGQLDLLNRADASMAPMQMREEALRDHRRNARFSEGLRKSKSSSGSQAGTRSSQRARAAGREFNDGADVARGVAPPGSARVRTAARPGTKFPRMDGQHAPPRWTGHVTRASICRHRWVGLPPHRTVRRALVRRVCQMLLG